MNGKACVADDDFNDVGEMLESADALVLVSPLYWFGVSAQIKSVIDKFHAYSSENCIRPLKIRNAVLIMCGETDIAEDFSGAVATYKNMIVYKGWNDLGIMTFTCVGNKGDAAKTGAADAVKEFGKGLNTGMY
jgi:multimeric flavodoxin WrbA